MDAFTGRLVAAVANTQGVTEYVTLMARPVKLDDLVEKRICDALRQGHSYARAAAAAGIDESTLHDWRRRGREEDGTRFSQFAERVERADTDAEERCLAVLRNALDGDDPKLATDTAWKWLARRRPATWAEQKGEPPPSEAEVEALVAKIRRSGTGDR